ncbi:patatin-like phospholipase family protein [Ralstonia sp. 22086]|nr:patatin-like phospholipase family protein [Ralstonia wenshanensis]MCT7308786.1 patatin-like phospholipase family protein [Ralstonia wenshanensis]MDY7508313.1 patatin-like phospholipase family protein [Ralstonia wenshanensis]UGS91215.1 patatin-like phospholipase family protein [Ralstonia wenshanensis]
MSPDCTALLMMGGGARAAYQVGVLRGIAGLAQEYAPGVARTPFDVICGTSAGAINSLGLARGAQDFTLATEALTQLWGSLHADRVYRTDVGRVGSSGARWLTALAFGWMTGRTPRALFDNTPLRELLESQHDGQQVQAAFDAGALRALAITALSYTTGRHVTFYQSPHVVLPWRRSQRIAVADQIGVAHMLASSSIPFIFPAEPVPLEGNDEWFGDGTMRQMSPLSPAIHLGANRILVVGAASRSQPGWYDTVPASGYPSLAQIAGQALASIFLDGLSADIERLQHVNAMVARNPEIADARDGWRKIEVLVMAPSERIELIASRHVQRLPGTVRALLKPLGGTEARGAAFASYLLFEPEFTQELIDLGERDVQARRDELAAFLYGAIPDTMRAA